MTTQAPVRADYMRQLDIVSPNKLRFPITVIGAGGIGSPLVIALTKMGCSDVTVIDFDSLEEHNLPNQLYPIAEVGQAKVEALANTVSLFSENTIAIRAERFENQPLSGVVICCVDNMATRQAVWQKVKLNLSVPLYIDARMAGEVAQVFALSPIDTEKSVDYEALLFTDEEAQEIACTAQAIIYNTFTLAGVICRIIKAHATEERMPFPGVVIGLDMGRLAFR